MKEYKNKESQEIEDFLNKARTECGLEEFLPEVEVRFIKPSNANQQTSDKP